MVFTGIVEEMGEVRLIDNLDCVDGSVNLTVEAKVTLGGVKIGDSISVNGACLTVTKITSRTFTFGLAPETLRRTNLSTLTSGCHVNLERSMSPDGRFGGHVMQGHVDCTGKITKIAREKDALWFTICIPDPMMKFVVEKGYITVDGASVTVCDVLDGTTSFTFMMIPHTQTAVVTALKHEGDLVNIEVDITAKYIDRILERRLQAQQQ